MNRAEPQSGETTPTESRLAGAWRACAILYTLTLVHLIIQRCVLGIRESPADLSDLWQLPSVAFMKTRPLESILYWHAYPSGFVAYWTFLIHGFGESAAKVVYQWVNLILAAGLAPAAYLIVLALVPSRRAALVAAVLVALSPSLPLYAAYYLYDLPTLVLLTFSVACIARYQLSGRRIGSLVAALWLLGALVCLRSFFHLGLCFLLLIWILSRRPGLRMGFLAVIAIIAPFAMYVKNYLLFGAFGASTMLGFNLSKVNVAPLSETEARALGSQGILPPIVARYPLFYPLVHGRAIYTQYGYDRQGASPVVNQDDFNNVNLIAISKVYGDASAALIRARPREYVTGLFDAFRWFCEPPSRSGWFAPRYSGPFEAYRTFYVSFIEGEWVGDLTPRWAGRPIIPSLVMVILPALLLSWIIGRFRANRLSVRRWRGYFNEHVTELGVGGMLLYSMILGTCCERGENTRYFLYVEPLYLCALVVGVVYLARWYQARSNTSPFPKKLPSG